MTLYAPTIFLSSFLLFLVQPLIGRYILPWFGGSPAVWTTCMLFFQVMLLAGYAYAHGATLLGRRHQGWLHLAVLIAALAFLPIAPAATWRPDVGSAPISAILLLLAVTIGVPYLVLSATAPLVQQWFARDCPGTQPYRLYALSNVASLSALLGYPLLVEPLLTRNQQVIAWSCGFALYAVLCAACALLRPCNSADVAFLAPADDKDDSRLSVATVILWFLLPASGTTLLLSTTNQLCQDVASVPFLWVVPLILYLATFIICFGQHTGYNRVLWGIVYAVMVLLACRTLSAGSYLPLLAQTLTYLAILFAACMVCHGELVRWCPAPSRLTVFYLVMATGGAAGGLVVALLPPLIFTGFWEYPLSLTAASFVIFVSQARDGAIGRLPRFLPLIPGTCLVVLTIFSWQYLQADQPGVEYRTRNFYGVLRIQRDQDGGGKRRSLVHGRVLHGTQYLDSTSRRQPTTYYGPDSGVGLTLRNYPRHSTENGLRVGIIGLGTGTLATYGKQGDTFRFYEINPAVVSVAQRFFTYLSDSAANIQLVTGDARLMLEGELRAGYRQEFDVLVVDAFSSDAIPVHLLTRESLALYGRHLRAGGIILFHASNHYLDLLPVMRTLGEEAGYRVVLLRSSDDKTTGTIGSSWLAMSRSGAFIDGQALATARASLPSAANRPWTDDYASLLPLLKW